MLNRSHITTLLLAISFVSGCAMIPGTTTSVTGTQINNAQHEIPEGQLLDVGIEIFEPGPVDESEQSEDGISKEIREAEARFIPVHLRNTMQSTGQWGAVRVIPSQTEAVDLLVKGAIRESDGEILVLKIDAYDAAGRSWFGRTYEAEARTHAYQGSDQSSKDAFQDLYNRIANDLADYKNDLDPASVEDIRTISELKFAAQLAPEAFDGYLYTRNGAYTIQRLPAHGDPMLRRVRAIREREYMLIDTVNRYYDNFYKDMWDPYNGWRESRGKEVAEMREIQRQARNRTLVGVAAIAGAIALDIMDVNVDVRSLQNVMILGGAAAIKSGMDKRKERLIHEDAIRELGESFGAEVTPLVVEVEGETVELTGSAEAQYENWREILRSIYRTETGLPAATHYPIETDARLQ